MIISSMKVTNQHQPKPSILLLTHKQHSDDIFDKELLTIKKLIYNSLANIYTGISILTENIQNINPLNQL